MKSTDSTFRVIRLSEKDRDQYRDTRDSQELKNHEAVEQLLVGQLPGLVADLAALGISAESGRTKKRPARLPFTPKALAALKSATKECGLPQVLLLRVALTRPLASKKVTTRRTSRKAVK